MNRERCEQVLSWIEANPKHWDQGAWHCGTTHCFAGVAEMMRLGLDAKQPINDPDLDGEVCGFMTGDLDDYIRTAQWCGFDVLRDRGRESWASLTHCENTLDDLRRIIRETSE